MRFDTEDTIAAIATAPGGAARGVVRVSGTQALECVIRCCSTSPGTELGESQTPRRWTARLRVESPLSSVPVDLFVWPTNRSYSRQPTVEIHTFGSPPLLAAILRTVCRSGARLAQPGEFTLRSFLAGRIDLPQAEAVLGVIDAVDQTELRVALAQAAGGVSAILAELRQHLLELLAHLEAGMDFSEEGIAFIQPAQLRSQLTEIGEQLSRLEIRFRQRGQATGASRVVLRGAPNVGKSSLFNALAGGGEALVSDESGTTRDYLTQRIECDGVCFQLIDTAGAEETSQGVMASTVQSAMQRQWSDAHLELFCIDAGRPPTAWERRQLADRSVIPRLVVWTKADLGPPVEKFTDTLLTSSRSGRGLDALRSAIARNLDDSNTIRGEVVSTTAARCRECLRQAGRRIDAALPWIESETGEEFIAVELRAALDELGQVVGAVFTDDILDQIFSRFCIGK